MLLGNKISKSRGSELVLRNVDIEVPEGSVSVVIGPSGAGKTTLLRILSLLDPADAGSVTMDSERLVSLGKGTLKNNGPWPSVTLVFQQLFLFPHLTLRQNIWLAAKKHSSAADLDEMVRELCMIDFIDRFPNEVSPGERQRAALARAAILRPKYLLCDELTSSIDVENVRIVLDFLAKISGEGTGVLLVTHNLAFARAAAERVYFLDRGEIHHHGDRGLLGHSADDRLGQFLRADYSRPRIDR